MKSIDSDSIEKGGGDSSSPALSFSNISFPAFSSFRSRRRRRRS